MNFSQGIVKMKENGTDFVDSKLRSTPIAMVAPELKYNADSKEITKTCAVSGCDDSKKLSSDEFFRFPEDPSFRELWTNLTGRSNWTPTDFSYICIQHFSVDSFEIDVNNQMVLVDKAVPSLKLPKHVLEIEYIEEEVLDNDYDTDMEEDYSDSDMDIDCSKRNGVTHLKKLKPVNPELLKLFTEVQMMQRQCIGLKDKLKYNMKIHNRQSRLLNRLNQIIEIKTTVLEEKRRKRNRVLLSLQDKIREDTTGLVLAMPTRHTDDLKSFALSIYKYSPHAYIYIRNTLRTMLPSTEVLDSWLRAGFNPKNLLTSNDMIKVEAIQSESELTCKITTR